MSATSRVDAIQKAVMAGLKKEAADYVKRNGRDNKPSEAFLRKACRRLVSESVLVDAFVEDALAAHE